MNYKKILVNLSILSLGAAFTAPTIVSASTALQEQEKGAAEQLADAVSEANSGERRVIKKIQQNPKYEILMLNRFGNGSTDSTILVYADKGDYKKIKKEIGNNPEQFIAGTPVEYYYEKEDVLVLKVKCKATTDEESMIPNFGQHERSVN